VSQVLTLYTTPIIYLMLAKLHAKWSPRAQATVPVPAASS